MAVGLVGVGVPVKVLPVTYWYSSFVKPLSLSSPLLCAVAPAQVGGVMLAVVVGGTQAGLTLTLAVALAEQPVPLEIVTLYV